MTDALLRELSATISGEVYFDETHRIAYATDASAYREKPQAVAFPKNEQDLQNLVQFANKHGIGIIPRTAGTSLAGQVVGSGIVVDVSKYLTNILSFNFKEQTVTVQPGVIRDELNRFLQPKGFLFGPETSTANRAMVGGMVGNNSCGSNSVMYGSTRDHLEEIEAILADGTLTTFKALSKDEFRDKLEGKTTSSALEQAIYQQAFDLLNNQEARNKITDAFPDIEIPRRNTGYALDLLMDSDVFHASSEKPFNFCKLIAGSEGTLCFITKIKLKVVPLPPPVQGLLCVHFNDLYQSLESTLLALEEHPGAVELMDHYILDCTKNSAEHQSNRFFIEGEPQALLIIQLLDESLEKVKLRADRLTSSLKNAGYGYHFPLLTGDDCNKVWQLRKAGLGLLSNIPGDSKPAPVIEDTAVKVKDLPAYIKAFNETLEKYKLECVHYAHAGTGELHLRPILNLKTKKGNALFKTILHEIATLVKEYKGSLSGEHGDGRLRGEFIPYMVGGEVYTYFEQVKDAWDPKGIMNPNKIVRTPSMNEGLRYYPEQETRESDTTLDFSDFQGLQRTAELCNGSGDCRKTEVTGGVMCPTYMATKEEVYSTRARANMVREHLTRSSTDTLFSENHTLESLDHCISCKGCKKECPSSVDLAKIKAEFEHQNQKLNGIPFSTRMIGNYAQVSGKLKRISPIVNAINKSFIGKQLLKNTLGISPKRDLPEIQSESLLDYCQKNEIGNEPNPNFYLYIDEFTNLNDTHIGKATFAFFQKFGLKFHVIQPSESGRTFISKGMLDQAKACAEKNVTTLKDLVSADCPVVGIEPSAILTFRDEYPDLLRDKLKEKASNLAENTLTLEEYLSQLIENGRIEQSQFKEEKQDILIHGHCHQKALSSEGFTRKILSFPKNYKARLIPSSCCGMAGSFGYQEKHYDLSMKIGETTLFPHVRKADSSTLIAAAGTSCRHQIWDGTNTKALHPIEILLKALKD